MKRIHIIAMVSLLLFIAGCSSPNPQPGTTEHPDPSLQSVITQPATVSPPANAEIPIPTEPIAPEEGVTEPLQIPQPEPEDAEFVRVSDYIPDIFVELRYATTNNFTGQQIYQFHDVWLRYGTVKKLMDVQATLRQQQLYLKIWDGFRPPAAQFKLWEVYPDSTYVSNPNTGFSSHSRGNTVDLTMVYADGTEVQMPTGFDDFSTLADRDYSDCPEDAAANALTLENAMKHSGFKPYKGEWWHFTDQQSYPVEKDFEPIEPVLYYANCNEYISLRTQPSTSADVITRIPVHGVFRVLARCGRFSMVEYQGLQGYVLSSYTLPAE